MQVRLPPTRQAAEVDDSRLSRLKKARWQRLVSGEQLVDLLRDALQSPSADDRLYAIRWAAEARVTELLEDLQQLLNAPPPGERYYLAVLGAIDWLSREPEQRSRSVSNGLLARELRNTQRSAESHALALRLMSPDYKDLTLEHLEEYLQSEYEPLHVEAVRTLALRTDEARFPLLEKVANDDTLSDSMRADALVGLSAAAAKQQPLFERFAAGDNHVLKREAQRVLRQIGESPPVAEEKPPAGDLAAWNKLLAEPGDAGSGRRLFFSPVGPKCSACHRHGGRGGTVGPDLTNLSQQSSRERTITSILDPSREIAPRYQPWLLRTDDGKTYEGLRLPKAGDNGQEAYADPAGHTFVLPSESIEYRQPGTTSIMPAGLEKSLTVADLRDLIAFLASKP
jgi:putative heme-binding domain-containing protein